MQQRNLLQAYGAVRQKQILLLARKRQLVTQLQVHACPPPLQQQQLSAFSQASDWTWFPGNPLLFHLSSPLVLTL